jgi:hypothetical protein
MAARILVVAGACVLAGCSYDWSIADSGIPEASADATPPVDASVEAANDGSSPSVDAVAETAADVNIDVAADGPSCASLEAAVQKDKAAAIACDGSTSACMSYAVDECGCKVVVGSSGSVATQDYEDAVAALKAHCTLGCATCPSPPQEGLCIVAEAGAGALACSQL